MRDRLTTPRVLARGCPKGSKAVTVDVKGEMLIWMLKHVQESKNVADILGTERRVV